MLEKIKSIRKIIVKFGNQLEHVKLLTSLQKQIAKQAGRLNNTRRVIEVMRNITRLVDATEKVERNIRERKFADAISLFENFEVSPNIMRLTFLTEIALKWHHITSDSFLASQVETSIIPEDLLFDSDFQEESIQSWFWLLSRRTGFHSKTIADDYGKKLHASLKAVLRDIENVSSDRSFKDHNLKFSTEHTFTVCSSAIEKYFLILKYVSELVQWYEHYDPRTPKFLSEKKKEYEMCICSLRKCIQVSKKLYVQEVVTALLQAYKSCEQTSIDPINLLFLGSAVLSCVEYAKEISGVARSFVLEAETMLHSTFYERIHVLHQVSLWRALANESFQNILPSSVLVILPEALGHWKLQQFKNELHRRIKSNPRSTIFSLLKILGIEKERKRRETKKLIWTKYIPASSSETQENFVVGLSCLSSAFAIGTTLAHYMCDCVGNCPFIAKGVLLGGMELLCSTFYFILHTCYVRKKSSSFLFSPIKQRSVEEDAELSSRARKIIVHAKKAANISLPSSHSFPMRVCRQTDSALRSEETQYGVAYRLNAFCSLDNSFETCFHVQQNLIVLDFPESIDARNLLKEMRNAKQEVLNLVLKRICILMLPKKLFREEGAECLYFRRARVKLHDIWKRCTETERKFPNKESHQLFLRCTILHFFTCVLDGVVKQRGTQVETRVVESLLDDEENLIYTEFNYTIPSGIMFFAKNYLSAVRLDARGILEWVEQWHHLYTKSQLLAILACCCNKTDALHPVEWQTTNMKRILSEGGHQDISVFDVFL